MHVCKSMAAEDKDCKEKEESKNDDDGDEDNGYLVTHLHIHQHPQPISLTQPCMNSMYLPHSNFYVCDTYMLRQRSVPNNLNNHEYAPSVMDTYDLERAL